MVNINKIFGIIYEKTPGANEGDASPIQACKNCDIKDFGTL